MQTRMPQQPGMGSAMAPVGQQQPDTPTRQQSMTMNVSLNYINTHMCTYMQDYTGNYIVASAKYAEPSVESLRHRQLRLRATGSFPTAEPGMESSMYLEHCLLE